MNLEEKLKAKSIPLMQKYMWIDQPAEMQKEQVILLKDALSICQEAVNEAKPKWISVKDRLPEQNKAVLIKTSYGKYDVCNLWIDKENNIIWVNDMRPQHSDGSVTHWMSLPESPELKEKL